ncbi:hypothetical protein GGX14DRAFT_627130, partial [Mycena pura]
MSRSTLFASILALSAVVRADYFSQDPLVDKVVPHDQIPYQVMTDRDDPRGFQSGYNICNSTTENQDSLCQTMYVNHIDDFCVWAPATFLPIADAEGDVVAWCSKKGHGTRIIPAGTFSGLQIVYTPSYISVAGFIDQAAMLVAGTDGGELDSGGQDGEGNPMGGLVYSNAFKSNNGNNGTFQQAQHWSFFIGDNYVCGKVCDQTGSNPQGLCNNIYDRLGCDYNVPSAVQNGTFTVCEGDDMTPVGEFVVNGVTSTYHQPAETDPIGVVPYTATPAATSNCVTYQSADIFTDGALVTAAPVSGPGASAPGGKAGSGSPTGSGSGAAPSTTGASGASAALGVSVGAMAAGFFAVLAL